MKATIVILAALLLVACSSNKYVVTFDSNPPGAYLICGDKNWGYTPKKLYYDKSVKEHSTMNVSDCKAQWSSGASETYPNRINVYDSGGTNITLQRPNTADYQQDAEFALKVQQMQYQKRQAEAAESSAYEQQRQNNKTTTCYTNFGITTCY